MVKMKNSKQLSFENTPFSRLIKESEELSDLHREYSSRPVKEKIAAADFQYHSTISDQLFNTALGQSTNNSSPWPGEVVALTIYPKYAPALLTVGSYEYQYGRIDESMKLFLVLTTLPKKTIDLIEIIDKAGDFLIENDDYKNAKRLYLKASLKYPNTPIFHNGLSYCFGKIKNFKKAIEHARHAVKIEPDNYKYLSDLGWSLVEAKDFEEAKTVLEKAVSLSPPDYELARGNLKELHRRIQST